MTADQSAPLVGAFSFEKLHLPVDDEFLASATTVSPAVPENFSEQAARLELNLVDQFRQ